MDLNEASQVNRFLKKIEKDEFYIETTLELALETTRQGCILRRQRLHSVLNLVINCRPRRIYRGAVNLILFRHCPSKIFWKCTIWNINIQYKNGWYTLQKLTKPVFALWKNFRIFFTVRSGKLSKVALFWGKIVNLHFFWVDIGKFANLGVKKFPFL